MAAPFAALAAPKISDRELKVIVSLDAEAARRAFREAMRKELPLMTRAIVAGVGRDYRNKTSHQLSEEIQSRAKELAEELNQECPPSQS